MRNQRQHYRHPVNSLAYVRLDHANGGIIRDLSESGMAVQAVGCLQQGQIVHLRFELIKPKVRIEGSGQVAWADTTGQAGLRFLDLSPRAKRLVKDWVLTDLLAEASELAPSRAPIFDNQPESSDGLIISPAPVAAIRIAESEQERADTEDPRLETPLRFSWWPADISPRTFARFVDSLVVLAAVLFFSVIAVETAGIFPTWPLASALLLGFTCVFAFLYRYFFLIMVGTTVGRRLVRLAAEDIHWSRKIEEQTARFR